MVSKPEPASGQAPSTLLTRAQALFGRAPKRTAAGVLLVLFAVYALYLSISVIVAFEGRRWDIPARVYAAPLEIYAGIALTPAELSAALDQTGYLRVDEVRHAGEYALHDDRILLRTRSFQHWDALEPEQSAVIEFDAERISAMRNEWNETLPLLRLEPMRLGSLFASHHEDRILVAQEDIPPLLVSALKTIEDRRFDSHFGLDFRAIARAAFVNVRQGGIRQGGSTLTQQLVKSYFLDSRQTFSRKIREAIMAVALELRYDKDELLLAYVNEIYLGQQGSRAIHGFGLASEFYFSKPLSRLELHEIALLVAIVKGPSYYDPRRHGERARERRNLVLATLSGHGVIDEQAAITASARQLGIGNHGLLSRYQPAYMDLVRRQLAADFPLDDLATEGLRIFTSLDPRIQLLVERELAAGLERLQPAENGDAVPLEGAAIVTRPQSGEVVAMVGGRDVEFDGFNRVTDARRPIGSLVKPVVYLAALQAGGYTLASIVSDEPIEIELDNGDTWAPQNFDRASHGDVPLLRALGDSYNQATVRLGMAIGVDAVAGLLHDLGLERRPDPNPSLLLGAIEMSPLEVAQVYNSLANGGFRMPLRALRSVVDAAGKPLVRYPLELLPAADTDAVQQVNLAMVQVLEHGTGYAAKAVLPAGLVAAGKTGTSDDFRDSWFAGFTNDHLAVVWVGNDANEPVGLTGSSGALNIWAPVIAGIDDTRGFDPAPSPALEFAWLDYDTGLGTYEGCGRSARVALPVDSRIPRLAGCGPGLRELGNRAKRWLEGNKR
ncbi:MAG TPA: penicillin-binding protein 1B [Woeseiaceae bacterium]|nr:penicillin-binding protein 1B [Woeseiaceae bacterium]